MRIEEDLKLDYQDVLIKPKRSTLGSRADVEIERTFRFRTGDRSFVPVIAANMSTVGTPLMFGAMAPRGMLTCMHKHLSLDELGLLVGLLTVSESTWHPENLIFSLGASQEDFDRYAELPTNVRNATVIACMDVANGYTQRFVDAVKMFRDEWPDKILMAGNVVSAEMTEELILSGVDIVKVGIGSGSACTTRRMTGVGYPQLSAVIECADAAHGLGGFVCADGGIVYPGDIAKALGAGADLVMLGGMLAGHNESGGKIVEHDGRRMMEFYGMSSEKANEEFSGGLKDYRTSEGRELLIPYRGPVITTLQQIEGGLRSACTYVGAKSVKELPKRTTFVRVLNQVNESLVRS